MYPSRNYNLANFNEINEAYYNPEMHHSNRYESKPCLKRQRSFDNNKVFRDALGDFWKEAVDQEDHVYYYNTRTRETTWSKPCTLVEVDPVSFYPQNTHYHSKPQQVSISTDYGYGFDEETSTEPQATYVTQTRDFPNSPWVECKLNNGKSYYFNKSTNISSWERPEELFEKKIDKKESKQRPVAVEPVMGTSWYIVLTGDGKHFFYNHSNSQSSWSKPSELYNNSSVDAIIDKFNKNKTILANQSMSNELSLKDVIKQKLGVENIDEEEQTKIKNSEGELNLQARDDVISPSNETANIAENIDDRHYSLDEKIKLFEQLLTEKNVSVYSTYESEIEKLESDYRFNLIQSKERKIIFNEFLQRRVETEKQQKLDEIKSKHEIFQDFLKSVVKSSKTSYTDILMKFSSDPRFKTIPKERERQALFMKYISDLKQEVNQQLAEETDKTKLGFIEMLSECEIDAHTPYRRVRKSLATDERFTAVKDLNLRELWFNEYIDSIIQQEKARDMERAKIEREKASIREREKQTNIERQKNDENIKRQRDSHKREIASDDFRALLVDRIRDSSISWREAKKLMSEDPRFKATQILYRDQYLKLFDKHLDMLDAKIKEAYHDLLDSLKLNLTADWLDVYPLVQDDPRCKKFSKDKKFCKNEFLNYLEKKKKRAFKSFEELLEETKMIDHRFLAKARLIPSLYNDLNEVLKKDSRFNDLDDYPDDRQKIIDDFLLKKQQSGLPPPPSAPSKRI